MKCSLRAKCSRESHWRRVADETCDQRDDGDHSRYSALPFDSAVRETAMPLLTTHARFFDFLGLLEYWLPQGHRS